MSEDSKATAYGSARDLPSYVELQEQLKWLKPFSWLLGRKRRAEILEIEKSLNELADTVDGFYSRLGERNWVFHDNLKLTAAATVIAAPTPEQAEIRLIEMYIQPGLLEQWIRQLMGLPAIRVRRPLIDKALLDYRDGRFYSTTLVLLTVMDGFVNDMDRQRRGLHAREPEDMVAWDSVVGHHMGLSHAHKTFRRGFRKTTADEVFELYRNGILHGMILNYDNAVVATKAWNRLFAVADWARSLERRAQPAAPQPTFKEVWAKLVSNAADQKVLMNWKPTTLLSSDEGYLDTPVATAAKRFLDAWQSRNYGQMAQLFPDNVISYKPASKPARVRSLFDRFDLKEYTIEKIDFTAAAVAEVDATVTVNGDVEPIRMRWIRDDPSTGHATPIEEKGEWRLYIGIFEAMKRRRVEG